MAYTIRSHCRECADVQLSVLQASNMGMVPKKPLSPNKGSLPVPGTAVETIKRFARTRGAQSSPHSNALTHKVPTARRCMGLMSFLSSHTRHEAARKLAGRERARFVGCGTKVMRCWLHSKSNLPLDAVAWTCSCCACSSGRHGNGVEGGGQAFGTLGPLSHTRKIRRAPVSARST